MAVDRYTSVTQALAIYRAIRRAHLTLDEIADRVGVSPQTVRRLLEALDAGGVRIDARRRKTDSQGQPPYEYRAGPI